jgi:hypothetical protein
MAVGINNQVGVSKGTERVSKTLESFTRQFAFSTQLRTDGISSFTLNVVLARNALVRKYEVVVHAQRASATAAAAVAQIRSTEASASDIAGRGQAVVLDFGTPRTVSGVQVPPGFAIVRVTPWIGIAFAPNPVYGKRASARATPPTPSSVHDTVILQSEVRTERLLVEVVGNGSKDELSSQMAVVLPEAPSDLEIRIDGGAPVVSFPGPAQPGTDSELSARNWNRNGERIVDLADALSKLTGDPTRSENVTFKVVLSSRVPGELGLAENGPPSLSFVRRVLFGADTSKELAFNEEGAQEFVLAGLPASTSVEEIRFTAVGTLSPERTIPPVGPGNAELADLVLDPNRAVCVRLRSGTGLAELTGLRLPLLAGSLGAQMRVVLWRNNESGSPEPVEAITEGVSEPVTLSAGGDTETWTTFSFKHPVRLTNRNPPWAALLVSRGDVRWSLGSSRGGSDPFDGNVIRRGAPTGPWKPLPSPFQIVGTSLGTTRGRIRVIGHAPKDAPLAPLIVNLGSRENVAVGVTPTAKGVAAKLTFPSPVSVTSPVLRVVSRIPGNVTLRDVDVVTKT